MTFNMGLPYGIVSGLSWWFLFRRVLLREAALNEAP